MNWPQITWIILSALALGIELSKHGEPRTGERNFWLQLFGTLVVAGVLWSGGFFSQAQAASIPVEARQYQRELTRNARAVWGLMPLYPPLPPKSIRNPSGTPAPVLRSERRGWLSLCLPPPAGLPVFIPGN